MKAIKAALVLALSLVAQFLPQSSHASAVNTRCMTDYLAKLVASEVENVYVYDIKSDWDESYPLLGPSMALFKLGFDVRNEGYVQTECQLVYRTKDSLRVARESKDDIFPRFTWVQRYIQLSCADLENQQIESLIQSMAENRFYQSGVGADPGLKCLE